LDIEREVGHEMNLLTKRINKIKFVKNIRGRGRRRY
jgi:hypothetical protein